MFGKYAGILNQKMKMISLWLRFTIFAIKRPRTYKPYHPVKCRKVFKQNSLAIFDGLIPEGWATRYLGKKLTVTGVDQNAH